MKHYIKSSSQNPNRQMSMPEEGRGKGGEQGGVENLGTELALSQVYLIHRIVIPIKEGGSWNFLELSHVGIRIRFGEGGHGSL